MKLKALVVVMALLAAGAMARQSAPDPSILSAEEVEQIHLALESYRHAEMDREAAQLNLARAEARRDAAEKEVERLSVVIVADHGFKPSKFRLSDDWQKIQPIEKAPGGPQTSVRKGLDGVWAVPPVTGDRKSPNGGGGSK